MEVTCADQDHPPATPHAPLALRRKIAFVLAFALASLAMLEWASRWASPEDFETWRQRSVRYTSHPEYHWRMQPGDYARAGQPLHTNRLGLRRQEPVVPEFRWPDTGSSSLAGIRIYGAVLNQEMTAIRGGIGYVEFAFGPGAGEP